MYVAGISLDLDKVFICICKCVHNDLEVFDEFSVEVNFFDSEFLDFFKKNILAISQKIKEKLNSHKISIDRFFLNLPYRMVNRTTVEHIVSLKNFKKITQKDIEFAKKQLEEVSLSWDERCLHHIVKTYSVDNQVCNRAPLGVVAKKIKLNSLLFFVKESFCDQIEEIFSDYGFNLSKFIVSDLSDFCMVCEGKDLNSFNSVIINICYKDSYFVFYRNGFPELEQTIDIDIVDIITNISKKFSIPFEIAKDVFEKYFSFQEVMIEKEVKIKNVNTYINLGVSNVNIFVKNYFKEKISKLLDTLAEKFGKDLKFFVIGRLNRFEGFDKFLTDLLPYKLQTTPQITECSNFGCLKYGLDSFFEKTYQGRESFFKRILNIYNEYF